MFHVEHPSQAPQEAPMYERIQKQDFEIFKTLQDEIARQDEHLEMIASENYASKAVLEAMGSHFTNKYAEGYPGRRYYGGCEFVDDMEKLAIQRAKLLYGAEHANVQPHSGAQANMAVYFSVLTPGDTLLGLDLAHGGHLTHGHPLNSSGILYNFKSYHVRKEDELLDMDQVRSLAHEHKPRMIVAGASAYSRHWDFRLFREIADEVGALLMVDMAHIAGLVASGHHPSPVPYADFVTTTTHKTLRGPRGGLVLCKEIHAKALDRSLFPGVQGGPLMHMVAAKAIAFKEALDPSFKVYGGNVVENAKALSQSLQEKGWRIVSGGTDNHLILVDVFAKGVLGSVAEKALDLAGITINKNGIPFDPNPPMKPSGIRLGTPAITTRGLGVSEMVQVGGWIHRVLTEPENEASLRQIRTEVVALTSKFPIPQ